MSDAHAQFDAEIAVDQLQAYLAVVDAVHHEFRTHVSEDGFFSTQKGGANVLGYEQTLGAGAFESLNVQHEGVFAIDVERTQNVLSKVTTDTVSLQYDSDLKLHIDGGVVEYDMSTISPELVDEFELNFEFDDRDHVVVTQSCEKLKRAVSTAELANDHVDFCYKHDTGAFIVGARDTGMDQAQIEYSDVDGDAGYLDVQEHMLNGGASFSSKYDAGATKKLFGPMDKETAVSVQFSEQHVTIWTYSLGNHHTVKNLIAPRLPTSG